MDIKYGVVRLFKFVCMTLIMGHWMACLFRLMSSLSTADLRECTVTDSGKEVPLHTSTTWVDEIYCSESCDCEDTFKSYYDDDGRVNNFMNNNGEPRLLCDCSIG